MKKPLAIGIDLGTATCRLAWLPDQKPPAAALGKPVAAWQAAGLESDPGPAWGHTFPHRKGDPARILQSLRELACAKLGAEVIGAVITHPAYKGSQERENLRQAAFQAGFLVVRLVSEPAAIVFGQRERLEPGQVTLIYSLGAGPLTVSLYKKEGNNLVELDTRPDKELSGHNLTAQLARALSREYQHRSPDDSYVGPNEWEKTAEAIKHRLSVDSETTCTLPPQSSPSTGRLVGITRVWLERLYEALIAGSLKLCDEMLAEANLSTSDLSGVWLEGGCKAIPMIQRQLSAWFGHEIVILDDHAVALGAAGQTLFLDWPQEAEAPAAAALRQPDAQETVADSKTTQTESAQAASGGTRPPILEPWEASERHIQAGNHEDALAAIIEVKKHLERQEARAIFIKAQALERQAMAEPSAGGLPVKPEELLNEAIRAYEQAYAKTPLDEYQKARDAAKRALDQKKARVAYQKANTAALQNNWYVALEELRKAKELDRTQSDYQKAYLNAVFLAIEYKKSQLAEKISQIKNKQDRRNFLSNADREIQSLVNELLPLASQNESFRRLIEDYRRLREQIYRNL